MTITPNTSTLNSISRTEDAGAHSLPKSIILHLLPGVLIGILFFAIAPFIQRNNLPSLWALGISDLIVIVPLAFGFLFYEGYRRNGRLSLDGIVLYHEKIPWWQYFIFVPVVFLSSAIIPLLAPLSNFIYDKLFSWWPAMYNLSMNLSGYSRSTIIATLIFNFLTVSLIAPIIEEIYFRGYLLPRLSRLGFWAVPIHTMLFALFHVWTPWMVVARAIGLIPFTFVAQQKRNIYIGMIAHILANTLDVVTGILLVLNLP